MASIGPCVGHMSLVILNLFDPSLTGLSQVKPRDRTPQHALTEYYNFIRFSCNDNVTGRCTGITIIPALQVVL
jgi:hypothetical protein